MTDLDSTSTESIQPNPSTIEGSIERSVAPSSASGLPRRRSAAEQIADIDVSSLPENIELMRPIELNNSKYLLEDWITKKHKRPRTSWVVDHGFLLLKLREHKADGTFWVCQICDAKKKVIIYSFKNTSGVVRHLKSHGLQERSDESSSPAHKRKKTDLDRYLEPPSDSLITQSTADQFKRLFIQWIVINDIPFNMVQQPCFRGFLSLLNRQLTAEFLPKSHTTVSKDISLLYLTYEAELSDRLLLSPFKKHLSFDLWTSPNSIAFLAVFCHFVDHKKTLQSRLLAFPAIAGSHSGENTAVSMALIVAKFGLTTQLGYLQSDNAETNDSCAKYLLRSLDPTRDFVESDRLAQESRVRCFDHILNVVAKVFFEGDSKGLLKALDPTDPRYQELSDEDRLLRIWRRLGPVGKLHNTVVWIRRSPQRRALFLEIAREEIELMLVVDCATRWNSVFFMIERALKLRNSVELFQMRMLQEKEPYKRPNKADILTAEDWDDLKVMLEVLAPLKAITKTFEGLWLYPESVSM
jgi:hypothetical protein